MYFDLDTAIPFAYVVPGSEWHGRFLAVVRPVSNTCAASRYSQPFFLVIPQGYGCVFQISDRCLVHAVVILPWRHTASSGRLQPAG